MGWLDRTHAYLSIAEHFEHISVKRFNGLVVASEDLLLNGAQVQRVRYLLIVLAVPDSTQKNNSMSVRLSSLVYQQQNNQPQFEAFGAFKVCDSVCIWHT